MQDISSGFMSENWFRMCSFGKGRDIGSVMGGGSEKNDD